MDNITPMTNGDNPPGLAEASLLCMPRCDRHQLEYSLEVFLLDVDLWQIQTHSGGRLRGP